MRFLSNCSELFGSAAPMSNRLGKNDCLFEIFVDLKTLEFPQEISIGNIVISNAPIERTLIRCPIISQL